VPQGLGEEEMRKSIETLQKMANNLNADMTVLRERDGVEGKVAEVLIRRCVSSPVVIQIMHTCGEYKHLKLIDR
jgi:GTPase